MMDPAPDSLPRWLWPLVIAGAALTVIAVTLGAFVLARGAADPPVAGPVAWADSTLAWTGESPRLLLPGESRWLPAPEAAILPAAPFTLSVSARLAAISDSGATWGIWAAASDGARIVWAIRGDGYLTIRRCRAGVGDPSVGGASAAADPAPLLLDCPALIPDWRWHAYPRIQPPGRANTLTLHREQGGIRLRINDELLGLAPVDLTGAWGVWVERSHYSGPAIITWLSAELRAVR